MNQMILRKKEDIKFPDYINMLREMKKNATEVINMIKENITWVPHEDLLPAEGAIATLGEWTEKKAAEKLIAPLTSDPILTEETIRNETFILSVLMNALIDEVKAGPSKRFKNMTLRGEVVHKMIRSWSKCYEEEAPK